MPRSKFRATILTNKRTKKLLNYYNPSFAPRWKFAKQVFCAYHGGGTTEKRVFSTGTLVGN